jgi:SAM-dependent methyltransferase
MIRRVRKSRRWIALGGIAAVAYWCWRCSRSTYRHRFTDLTDALVSSSNPGWCIYNWGFNVLGGHKHEAFRQRIIDLAELRGVEAVLDAGCGTGLTTLRIAEQYPQCKVCGIDLSPKMIEVARNDAEERGLIVDLRVGSIIDMPYPDAVFDVVLTNIMFHHLDSPEKRQAVAEIARVLRSPTPAEGRFGGRYVSAEFGPRARNPVERRLSKGEYTLYPSHLAEAGLSIRHEELSSFIWGLQVYYRVAVKSDEMAPESIEEERP